MERMPNRAPLARGVMLGLCVIAMVGCGGGGGGGGNVRSDPPPAGGSTTPTTPTTPPPVPVPPPSEPSPVPPAPGPSDPDAPVPGPIIDAHLYFTHAYEAQEQGLTGKGVGIVVVDTGLKRDHPALASRVLYSADTVTPGTYTPIDSSGHGTQVAQIAAGSKVGRWPRGVAPEAHLTSLRVITDEAAKAGGKQKLAADDPLFNAIASEGYGGRGRVLNIATDALWWDDERAGDTLASVLGASVTSAAYSQLAVVPTGNAGASQPSQLAMLPTLPDKPENGLYPSQLKRGWINVAAVQSADTNTLASYSNACGATRDFCMVAPGDVTVTALDATVEAPTYQQVHGTEFASAQVAGAAALVWQRFPTLSSEQVQQILLRTAKDLGDPGVDATFGWGLLDAAKAVRGPTYFGGGDFKVELGNRGLWTFLNPISGDGGLYVHSTDGTYSTLSLEADTTYTGTTTIQGPIVTSGYSMKSPVVVVGGTFQASGGTYEGDLRTDFFGTLAITPDSYRKPLVVKGDIYNQGRFTYATSTSADAVFEGDFTQPIGAYYQFMLGDRPMHLKGQATLDGELQVIGIRPGYVANEHTTVLIADGGVVGTFWRTWASSHLLVESTLRQDANSVWLDVVRAETRALATSASLSPAAVGGATRLDDAFDRVDALTRQGASSEPGFVEAAGRLQRIESMDVLDRSLTSLSGELHDADSAFAMLAIDGNRNELESRVDSLAEGGAPGAWSQALDGKRQWSAFDMDTNGWMLGFDRVWSTRLTLGASLSETNGNAWHSQRVDRERNRQVDAQLYASWNLGEGAYLLGSASFGHMQRWLQREVLLGDDAYRVSTDYAHRYGALSLQSGRRIPFGNSVVTPYVGVQALQLTRDGFSEEGASGFGLTSGDASMSATQALAGARWSRDWAGASTRWALSGRVEWQRLLSQSDASIQARFTGLDAWAPIVADGLDRNVGLFGLGLEAGIGAHSTLRFDLDSRYGDGEQWTGAMAKWTTAF